MNKNYFVHESSYADEGSSIGEGSKIWHFSHISKGAKIGKNCILGQNVFIGGGVVIGNGVKIQNNVSIYDKIVLEDYVFCGPSCVFTNVFNPRSEYPRDRGKEFLKTVVKRGASIGANSTIICGHTIGSYAFVGAGSVVTKDIPDYALAYGNPARICGWICECGEKIKFDKSNTTCERCKKDYIKSGNKIEKAK